MYLSVLAGLMAAAAQPASAQRIEQIVVWEDDEIEDRSVLSYAADNESRLTRWAVYDYKEETGAEMLSDDSKYNLLADRATIETVSYSPYGDSEVITSLLEVIRDPGFPQYWRAKSFTKTYANLPPRENMAGEMRYDDENRLVAFNSAGDGGQTAVAYTWEGDVVTRQTGTYRSDGEAEDFTITYTYGDIPVGGPNDIKVAMAFSVPLNVLELSGDYLSESLYVFLLCGKRPGRYPTGYQVTYKSTESGSGGENPQVDERAFKVSISYQTNSQGWPVSIVLNWEDLLKEEPSSDDEEISGVTRMDITYAGPTGVAGVAAGATLSPVWHTPSGQRVSRPRSGLHLLREPDGRVRKVMVR